MAVVINELEVVPGPAAAETQAATEPPRPEQTTNPSPADLEAVLTRLCDRRERVRAS
ncbi:MAG TPA: hypothetical protein VKE74_08095 [Gemmataceae bacterium]|nr:hypothetical protein [Gemmataceae bacterium]